MTKGKHNLSIGGEYASRQDHVRSQSEIIMATLGFSTSAPTSTGVAIADFVTGQISSFEQDTTYTTHLSTCALRGVCAGQATGSRHGSRSTLDSGGTSIRLPSTPMTGHRRLFSGQPILLLFTSTNSVVAARPGVPWDSGIRSRHHQHAVQPHFASCRFCIRSVWEMARPQFAPRPGIFYGSPSGNEWNQPGNAMPFSIRNGFGSETSLTSIYNVGFPTTAPVAASSRTSIRRPIRNSTRAKALKPSARNFKDSSVYQFNLSVQRQLPARIRRDGSLYRYSWPSPVNLRRRQLRALLNCRQWRRRVVGGLSTSANSQEQRRQFDAASTLRLAP